MLSRRKLLNTMGIVSGMGIIPDSFANLFRESLSEVPLLINRNKNNSYWYIGHLMSLLLTSKETGGKYALLRATERRGFEPPPHTHTKEDETFLILEGEVIYTVGDQTFYAKVGDTMFLPKNIEHSFKIQSEKIETLILLTPGGLENYFIEMSEPAKELVLPPLPQSPPNIPKLIAMASKYGVKFSLPK